MRKVFLAGEAEKLDGQARKLAPVSNAGQRMSSNLKQFLCAAGVN
ncbi:MAG: hypothetical protein AAGU11_04600 [Syntrophobacteraceae bacterium]